MGVRWWFLDQLEGMTNHLNTLSNIGIISTFIGMITDSRSFYLFLDMNILEDYYAICLEKILKRDLFLMI